MLAFSSLLDIYHTFKDDDDWRLVRFGSIHEWVGDSDRMAVSKLSLYPSPISAFGTIVGSRTPIRCHLSGYVFYGLIEQIRSFRVDSADFYGTTSMGCRDILSLSLSSSFGLNCLWRMIFASEVGSKTVLLVCVPHNYRPTNHLHVVSIYGYPVSEVGLSTCSRFVSSLWFRDVVCSEFESWLPLRGITSLSACVYCSPLRLNVVNTYSCVCAR